MMFTGYYDSNGLKLRNGDKVAARLIEADEPLIVGRIGEADADMWCIYNYDDKGRHPQLFECALVYLIGRDGEKCDASTWARALAILQRI